MPGAPLVFKCPEGDAYAALKNILKERGWVEFDARTHEPNEWNLTWRYPFSDATRYTCCSKRLQRVNHYGKTSGICNKESLTRHMRRMAAVHGSRTFGFYPPSFILPLDYRKFVAEFQRRRKAQKRGDGKRKKKKVVSGGAERRGSPSTPRLRRASSGDTSGSSPRYGSPEVGSPAKADPKKVKTGNMWICKPSAGSQGQDIVVFSSLKDLTYNGSCVVQRYVANPHLIGGHKYDLRLYVLVESFRPLEVYLYREGLARFSTEKYDLSNLDNNFSHLTNSSINKHSATYALNKDIIGRGGKWTLERLFRHLRKRKVDVKRLWLQINNLILLTLLPIVHEVPPVPACFELFGFDVILDRQLRPWLLEVNASPSISCSCEVDRAVKLPMLEDVLDIMGWDTDTYPPETMRRLHRDAANTLSLEEQRRRVLSGKAHADDFLLPKHLRSLASPGSPSSPPPEAVDYKNVRSKVSTRWGRGGAAAHSSARQGIMPPFRRRSSRPGGSTRRRGAVPVVETEDDWDVDLFGDFERIYPFNRATAASGDFIDPLGFRAFNDTPFTSKQFDNVLVSEIRARMKRYNAKRKKSKPPSADAASELKAASGSARSRRGSGAGRGASRFRSPTESSKARHPPLRHPLPRHSPIIPSFTRSPRVAGGFALGKRPSSGYGRRARGGAKRGARTVVGARRASKSETASKANLKEIKVDAKGIDAMLAANADEDASKRSETPGSADSTTTDDDGAVADESAADADRKKEPAPETAADGGSPSSGGEANSNFSYMMPHNAFSGF